MCVSVSVFIPSFWVGQGSSFSWDCGDASLIQGWGSSFPVGIGCPLSSPSFSCSFHSGPISQKANPNIFYVRGKLLSFSDRGNSPKGGELIRTERLESLGLPLYHSPARGAAGPVCGVQGSSPCFQVLKEPNVGALVWCEPRETQTSFSWREGSFLSLAPCSPEVGPGSSHSQDPFSRAS